MKNFEVYYSNNGMKGWGMVYMEGRTKGEILRNFTKLFPNDIIESIKVDYHLPSNS